ncbi:MAG: MMPL family transporter [Cellvibrionaceae bacterium]|nr:MMPL family transporter [Cellvibrionaceae bacterium]
MVSRILFCLGVVYILVFFAFTGDELRLDTRLNDLSPTAAHSPDTRRAIDALVDFSERRLVLGLVGDDAEQVSAASAQLHRAIAQIPALAMADNTDNDDAIMQGIKPYRFRLLTQTQRHKLAHSDDETLVTEAQQRLYQLDHPMVSFHEDPLAWFSDYMQEQLAVFNQYTANASAVKTSAPIAFERKVIHIKATAMSAASQQRVPQQLVEVATEIEQAFSVQVLRSGVLFFAADAAARSQQDIERISTLSLLATVLLLVVVFRSLFPLILPFLSMALGVAFAFAAVHTLFGAVHLLTLVFGASLIGIVVDYSLHFFCHQLLKERSDPHRGNDQTLYRALLLSMLTSLLAYGVLSVSGIEALKKIAVFSCCGLLMAWLSVVVIGPWLVSQKMQRLPGGRQRALFSGFVHSVRLPKTVQRFVLVTSLLSPWLLFIMGQLTFSDDPSGFFHASDTLIAQQQQLRSLSNSYEPGRYLLIEGSQSDEVYQRFAAVVSGYQREAQQALALYSPMTIIPAPEQQLRDYQLQARLYQSGGVVEQLFKRLHMPPETARSLSEAYDQAQSVPLDPADLVDDLAAFPPLWINRDDKIISLSLLETGVDHALLQKLSEQLPGVDYISQLQDAQQNLSLQRQSALQLLLLVFVLLAVLIAVYSRSVKAVGVLLAPLMGVSVAVSVLAISGQALTLFHVMALFLVLGLGMDYVIFATAMRREQAVTQQAIILSAVTSLFSFGLLSLSAIPVAQAFGLTVLIGNSVNLLAALNLSPAYQKP